MWIFRVSSFFKLYNGTFKQQFNDEKLDVDLLLAELFLLCCSYWTPKHGNKEIITENVSDHL